MSGLLSALVGWLFFGALGLMIGTVAGRWWVVPSAARTNRSREGGLIQESARIGFGAAAFLPLLVILLLIRQSMEFRDPYSPLTDELALLLGTPWGTAWKSGMGAATLSLAGMTLAVRGRRFGWWLASAGAFVLAAYPTATGHASAVEGRLRLLSLSGDLLHLLAAGVWLGGLAVILLLERRWRRDLNHEKGSSLLPALVPAFSPVAVVSVGVLVLSGLFASWLHLPSPSSLLTSSYGRILLVKVLLAMVVMGLGGWNWRRLSPRLFQPNGPPSLRRAAGLELALGTLVLLLTAILVRTSPLGH